ncbi:hypothetical protein BGZ76_006417 [Entomortierella beljakovae]|nr:hypothetical protein BGZ76_006417 [Entomortierella beljakovae]
MKTTTVVAATISVLAVATIGYAIYFDSKRRNDPEFRRKLKKERKRAQKIAKDEAKRLSTQSAQTAEEALSTIKDDDFPASMEEREKFCMEQLSAGEALFTQGPQNFGQAAICFYKALKVYPAPAELVMVYQKTIPPEVFNIVMGMLSKDVQSKQEKYYTVFPDKEMNVKVVEKPEGVTADGQKVTRRGLVATKSFTAGQTIYSEVPVISSLDPSLEGTDFCHYCLKEITDSESKVPCNNCTQVIYCSDNCRTSASKEFHDILCTKDSGDISPEGSLHEETNKTRNLVTEMLAKFLVKMVHEESLNSGGEYNSFDHMERLRYLEIPSSKEIEREMELLKVALGSNIPGIDEFITEERYLLMKGRLLYNIYGISTALDKNRKVEPLPERHRSTRDTPVTGAGFYRVSSYLMHSCEPNAKLVFSDNTNKVSIVAQREIQEGDELLVGYIKNGKLSTEDRRLELFTKYRFQCEHTIKAQSSKKTSLPGAFTDSTSSKSKKKKPKKKTGGAKETPSQSLGNTKEKDVDSSESEVEAKVVVQPPKKKDAKSKNEPSKSIPSKTTSSKSIPSTQKELIVEKAAVNNAKNDVSPTGKNKESSNGPNGAALNSASSKNISHPTTTTTTTTTKATSVEDWKKQKQHVQKEALAKQQENLQFSLAASKNASFDSSSQALSIPGPGAMGNNKKKNRGNNAGSGLSHSEFPTLSRPEPTPPMPKQPKQPKQKKEPVKAPEPKPEPVPEPELEVQTEEEEEEEEEDQDSQSQSDVDDDESQGEKDDGWTTVPSTSARSGGIDFSKPMDPWVAQQQRQRLERVAAADPHGEDQTERFARVLSIKPTIVEDSIREPIPDGFQVQKTRSSGPSGGSSQYQSGDLTKKQRENLAKAAKKKEEKIAADAIQEKRRQEHMRQVKAEKMKQFYKTQTRKQVPVESRWDTPKTTAPSSSTQSDGNSNQLIWD